MLLKQNFGFRQVLLLVDEREARLLCDLLAMLVIGTLRMMLAATVHVIVLLFLLLFDMLLHH